MSMLFRAGHVSLLGAGSRHPQACVPHSTTFTSLHKAGLGSDASSRNLIKSSSSSRQSSHVTAHASALEADLQAVPVHPEIGDVLFSEADLAAVVARLGRQVGEEYQGKDLLVIGVLKGAFMFTSDLVRVIHPFPTTLEVGFLKASSYGSSSTTSGEVKIDSGFNLKSVTGKDVLVVEDIMDTGLTLTKIVAHLNTAGPKSVRICTLLDKKARRRVPLQADFVGLECPDAFIVGYGIDYNEKYRNLPYIGVPRPEFVTS